MRKLTAAVLAMLILLSAIPFPGLANADYTAGIEALKDFFVTYGFTFLGTTDYPFETGEDSLKVRATCDESTLSITASCSDPASDAGLTRNTTIVFQGEEVTVPGEYVVLYQALETIGAFDVTVDAKASLKAEEITPDYLFTPDEISPNVPEDELIETVTDSILTILSLLEKEFEKKNAEITLADLGFANFHKEESIVTVQPVVQNVAPTQPQETVPATTAPVWETVPPTEPAATENWEPTPSETWEPAPTEACPHTNLIGAGQESFFHFATCSSPGYAVYVCAACHETVERPDPVRYPQKPHDVAEDGKGGTYCYRCGLILSYPPEPDPIPTEPVPPTEEETIPAPVYTEPAEPEPSEIPPEP